MCPQITSGWYEPAVTELSRHLVKEGMTVIDVGANAGWYTLLAAKRVGKAGRVTSFEPEPTNFSPLNGSVELNQFSPASSKNVRRAKRTLAYYTSRQNTLVDIQSWAETVRDRYP